MSSKDTPTRLSRENKGIALSLSNLVFVIGFYFIDKYYLHDNLIVYLAVITGVTVVCTAIIINRYWSDSN